LRARSGSRPARCSLRSEIGKLDLDRTFEERTTINHQVVTEIDKASEAWGVKVLRYEIKNIRPPKDITEAMEKQMRAEREKRAAILKSEGERDALITTAEGVKQQEIKASEAKKQQNINEAEGEAAAIRSVAQATADGIHHRRVRREEAPAQGFSGRPPRRHQRREGQHRRPDRRAPEGGAREADGAKPSPIILSR
jgi:regulator of protease activity HflC (stomatin/prohibitin superfamily)